MKTLFWGFLTFASLSAEAEILEGIAKNRQGEVLYVERHTIEKGSDGLNKFIRVEYSRPNGEKFASMVSDFSQSKTLPNTTFEDKRFNSKASVRIVDDKVEFEKMKEGKSISKKVMPFKESMVASQGFDNFVRMNFSRLETEPVEFHFGVLESKDFFSLTGYRKPASTSGDHEFGIKASSWLVRLFAGELRVGYDSKTKQLKSFAGRSNILSDAGQSQDVVITYQVFGKKDEGL